MCKQGAHAACLMPGLSTNAVSSTLSCGCRLAVRILSGLPEISWGGASGRSRSYRRMSFSYPEKSVASGQSVLHATLKRNSDCLQACICAALPAVMSFEEWCVN